MAGGSHYFDRTPAVGSRRQSVVLALPDLTLTLATDRGVFARDGVDPGTKYLLCEGPRPASGEADALLDLGCGYGAIALALARRAPAATVWAVDVNERALALTRANAGAAGIANVVAAEPDAVPDDLRFAGIWSNPPIRVGKSALHELLERWLARLAPAAEASLVVHKHLGSDSLAGWLAERGHDVRRVGSRAGYRILVARGPGAMRAS